MITQLEHSSPAVHHTKQKKKLKKKRKTEVVNDSHSNVAIQILLKKSMWQTWSHGELQRSMDSNLKKEKTPPNMWG